MLARMLARVGLVFLRLLLPDGALPDGALDAVRGVTGCCAAVAAGLCTSTFGGVAGTGAGAGTGIWQRGEVCGEPVPAAPKVGPPSWLGSNSESSGARGSDSRGG